MQYHFFTVLLQFRNDLNGFVVMIAPDVFSVDNACKEDFSSWEALFFYERQRLLALYKIKTDTVEIQLAKVCIAVPYITEICLQQNLYRVLFSKNGLIQLYEKCTVCIRQVHNKAGFFQLYPFSTQICKFGQNFSICTCSICSKVCRSLFTRIFCKL